MSRFIAAITAVLLCSLPALALADSFQVGNITNRSLHFSLRCNDGSDGWHVFTLGSLAHRNYASGNWNYRCDNERYQLRVETTANDGSHQYTTIVVRPGGSYALVYSPEHSGFVAYDTRWMVAMRNEARFNVHVSYRCVDGGNAHGVAGVTSGKIGWFYSEGCSRYHVLTKAKSSDGTVTSWSRDIDANNVYRILWSSNRQAYVLEQI